MNLHSLRAAFALAPKALLAGVLLAAPAHAEGPAVESPNGKLSFDAGRTDGESLEIFDGSFAFPISESFGAQLDGASGLISEDDFAYGLGAQIFWRDPELALVGLEAIYADRPEEDVAVRRFGVTSELYRERFTASGSVGYSRGDVGNGAYASLGFTFYPLDDLALRFGGALAPGEKGDLFSVGVEYQPGFAALGGLSLFADGAAGEADFESVRVGVRYYFDEKQRPLKLRQRQQDPDGIGFLLGTLEKREEKVSCPVAPVEPPVPFLRLEEPGPGGCGAPMPMYPPPGEDT